MSAALPSGGGYATAGGGWNPEPAGIEPLVVDPVGLCGHVPVFPGHDEATIDAHGPVFRGPLRRDFRCRDPECGLLHAGRIEPHVAVIAHPVEVPADKGRVPIGEEEDAAPGDRQDQAQEENDKNSCHDPGRHGTLHLLPVPVNRWLRDVFFCAVINVWILGAVASTVSGDFSLRKNLHIHTANAPEPDCVAYLFERR